MFGIRIDAPSQRSMERQSQKRARAEDCVKDKCPEKKRQHNHNHLQQQNYQTLKPNGSGASCSMSAAPLSPFLDGADITGYRKPSPAAGRPVGLFEFPWQKERLVLDADGWNLRDVFFCSLVDGCSAWIGLPGDRLGRRGAPFTVRLEDWPWTLPGDRDEFDGADCIWSCALQQPLLAAGGFSPASVGVGTSVSAVAAPATANAS